MAGKFTGPVRWGFGGNPAKARQYTGISRLFLQQAKERMGEDKAFWTRWLPDGTRIIVSSLGGVNQVWIDPLIPDAPEQPLVLDHGFLVTVDGSEQVLTSIVPKEPGTGWTYLTTDTDYDNRFPVPCEALGGYWANETDVVTFDSSFQSGIFTQGYNVTGPLLQTGPSSFPYLAWIKDGKEVLCYLSYGSNLGDNLIIKKPLIRGQTNLEDDWETVDVAPRKSVINWSTINASGDKILLTSSIPPEELTISISGNGVTGELVEKPVSGGVFDGTAVINYSWSPIESSPYVAGTIDYRVVFTVPYTIWTGYLGSLYTESGKVEVTTRKTFRSETIGAMTGVSDNGNPPDLDHTYTIDRAYTEEILMDNIVLASYEDTQVFTRTAVNLTQNLDMDWEFTTVDNRYTKPSFFQINPTAGVYIQLVPLTDLNTTWSTSYVEPDNRDLRLEVRKISDGSLVFSRDYADVYCLADTYFPNAPSDTDTCDGAGGFGGDWPRLFSPPDIWPWADNSGSAYTINSTCVRTFSESHTVISRLKLSVPSRPLNRPGEITVTRMLRIPGAYYIRVREDYETSTEFVQQIKQFVVYPERDITEEVPSETVYPI